jgi:thioredoxin-related protein
MILCFPLLLNAQGDGMQSIKWIKGLTWQQIKQKAKGENKYIFVDCYATWCGPCKLMDKEVYTNEKVGNFFNEHFVSLKVQMDSTGQDQVDIKKWYRDAREIQRHFNVHQFPTYLFFDSQGKIVHRGIGAVKDSVFLMMANDAITPSKQFYTLLKSYSNRKNGYMYAPYLIKVAKFLNEDSIVRAIGHDYLVKYLYKLDDSVILQKENLQFVHDYMLTSNERGFKIFKKYTDRINEIVGIKNFAQGKIEDIITKEIVEAKLWPNNRMINTKPNWNKLYLEIANKYDTNTANSIILNSQINWYSRRKAWPEIIKYNVIKIEKYGFDTSGIGKTFLNNLIYEVIFLHSEDSTTLKKAIGWMDLIIQARPNTPEYLDTYANLLYKIGNHKRAIEVEQKAVALNPADIDLQNTLNKMKSGKKTW